MEYLKELWFEILLLQINNKILNIDCFFSRLWVLPRCVRSHAKIGDVKPTANHFKAEAVWEVDG